jgi:hypothetical protein
MATKKIERAHLGIVLGPKRECPAHEANVAAAPPELCRQTGVAQSYFRDIIKHIRRQEWVIIRTEKQCRPLNTRQEVNGARAMIVVPGAREAMHRSGNRVIELIERAGFRQTGEIEQGGVLSMLCAGFPPQAAKEASSIHARQPPLEMP